MRSEPITQLRNGADECAIIRAKPGNFTARMAKRHVRSFSPNIGVLASATLLLSGDFSDYGYRSIRCHSPDAWRPVSALGGRLIVVFQHIVTSVVLGHTGRRPRFAGSKNGGCPTAWRELHDATVSSDGDKHVALAVHGQPTAILGHRLRMPFAFRDFFRNEICRESSDRTIHADRIDRVLAGIVGQQEQIQLAVRAAGESGHAVWAAGLDVKLFWLNEPVSVPSGVRRMILRLCMWAK